MKNKISLKDLINYCFGYIKLVNPSFNRFRINTYPINSNYLSTDILFNSSFLEDTLIPLELEDFYRQNQSADLLDKDTENEYLKQRELALKINEIKDKYLINEYTKQINLNFGYFKLEVYEPSVTDLVEDEIYKQDKELKVEEYPLFSIPIDIITERNKYYIKFLDTNLTPNLGFLQNVLNQNRFYDFIGFINKIEQARELTIPVNPDTIEEIWEELKGKLKLSDAVFDEKSFGTSFFVISLSTKANYFMTQDYNKLIEIKEEDFNETSLSSWISNEELSIYENFNEEKNELFFPFEYNKYQLSVLSIIKNRAAIVEGPPGTGKSQTIANLLCHLAANDKKVLFLSQKPQAIKVVKDFLKKLEINYLYGYIPNRYSSLYSPEEEKDSVANSLQGIEQYISSLDYQEIEKLNNEVLLNKNNIKNFNESIKNQQDFYKYHTKLSRLKKYNINIRDIRTFIKKFNYDTFKRILNLEKELKKNKELCSKYISKNSTKVANFDSTFSEPSLRIGVNNYSNSIRLIIDDIDKRYERGNKLIKIINKTMLDIRFKRVLEDLPLEIFDIHKETINSNKSNAQVIRIFKELADYLEYKERLNQIDKLSKFKINKLKEFGLDNESFDKLKTLVSSENFYNVFQKILDYFETEKTIRRIKLLDANTINKYLKKQLYERRQLVKLYLRNRIKNRIKELIYKPEVKGRLAIISRALRKSKKAYKTFDNLKNDPENFNYLKDVIPIWIMDLEDVSRLIPLEKNIFDYVIVDESSQCNIAYALPAMFRAKRTIFFGDSEQMRDDSVRFKTNKSLEELARKFNIPDHLQIKSIGDSVKSIFDLGRLQGFPSKALLYHYRSPKELIGFSNENFYSIKGKRLQVINSNYLTFGNTDKIMINHFIKPRKNDDISDKTNIAEAEYITNLIAKIRSDEKMKDRSIGVLTFFSEQAILLRNFIEDKDVKVSIIEGIQGDEKDIIIYSFVIADASQKMRYTALTGEGGEINKFINEGRVNVAFSRARLQAHCVTSMPIESWPDGIWIKRYLEYVEDNGDIDFYDQELREFGSKFEEEFYYFIRSQLNKYFIIQNQVESCGFKIDFVITSKISQKQLAIECDGPCHFTSENSDIYVESDIERQVILESAGWIFYRIKYSDWISKDFNNDLIIENIKDYFKKEFEQEKSQKNLSIFEDNSKKIDPFEKATQPVLNEEDQFSKKEIIRPEFAEARKTNDFENQRLFKDDSRLLDVNIAQTETRKILSEKHNTSEIINDTLNLIEKNRKINNGTGTKDTSLKKDLEIKKPNKSFKKNISSKEFEEITRLRVNKKREIVVSYFDKRKFIIINEYIDDDDFTGFSKRNLIISKEDITDFVNKSLSLLNKIDKSEEFTLRWKGKKSGEKIIIRKVNNNFVDARQYIETDKYTGFTRRGLRIDNEKFSELVNLLKEIF